MTVDLHYAEKYLPELIAAAEAGEDVVIATSGRRAVKLVVTTSEANAGDRQFGRLKDKLNLPEGWEEEWDRMGEELSLLMNDGPLSTSD